MCVSPYSYDLSLRVTLPKVLFVVIVAPIIDVDKQLSLLLTSKDNQKTWLCTKMQILPLKHHKMLVTQLHQQL